MWANRVQLEGNDGPGRVMPVLLPLLLLAVMFVAGLYGGALTQTIEHWEQEALITLQRTS